MSREEFRVRGESRPEPRTGPGRRQMRRAVVLLPNGATLLNLFFGIFAIVAATRGQFNLAGWCIVLGGVADALDGRIARATGTGSRFGEELDSLVDGISFGLAPALIMYFAALSQTGWDWIYVFIFAACAVMRLARFNVEQAGRKKTHFHGLPSPAAGMTLATYYWFSQTRLYNDAVIFFTDNRVIADFNWHVILRVLMIVLAFLMVSDVPYPAVPTVGFRSVRQIVGSVVVLAIFLGLIFLPKEFFFPALVVYIVAGAAKFVFLGFLDPQGQAVAGALHSLGFDGVREVHVGRHIVIELAARDGADAEREARDMCRRLLANPVTEDYEIASVEPLGGPTRERA